MVDFAKLRDPAVQKALRERRESEEAEREALENELNAAITLCLAAVDSLSDMERSLVRNCRHRLTTFRLPSEKQQKWLMDIANKLK